MAGAAPEGAAARAARQLRGGAWVGFFGLILWAWWQMYLMAAGAGLDLFGNLAALGRHHGHGGLPAVGPETASLSVLVPMWAIMMAAMMAPTAVPALRSYEELIGSGAGTRAGFVGLAAGYLGLWTLFAAGFGALHAGFIGLGLVDHLGESASRLFSAGLLAVAGLYQFSDAKARCLSRCRSPMLQFMADWRPGPLGGMRMGGRIGLWCAGCCWAIMALAFVGGTMNLAWMGAATLIMTLEKLPDLGRWLTRPLGVLFLGAAGLAAAGLL